MNYKIENDFEYKGLRCVVVFQRLGHRCGYVGIPKSHKFYGKDYDEIDNLECHGGITYSGGNWYPVESDLWWFGFDCAHCDDGKDLDTALEYFPEYAEQISTVKQIENTFPTYNMVKDKEYVEENCRDLVDQLIAIK